ncbi:MAG: Mrp/NBP35 family ATP-binding protein [Bacteroidales bacterium]|nr:Mrp/NBP35 family ATP-binding protein [Bacteroidales bacterium]
MEVTKDLIISKLKDIIVPESNKPVSEYIKELQIEDKNINLKIDLDKKSSPLKNSLEKVVSNVLTDIKKAGYNLNLTVTAEKLEFQKVNVNPQVAENPLDKVKNIIAVASGKGGVGKSTVSTNLAIALAKTGAKVGLLDADVYGPSIPTMFGLTTERPMVEKIDEKDYIIPFEKFGIKLISIGFFVKEEDALIWRGSMATSAVKQLINDVKWGDLDYFVIDLPPGTGDVPLTMVQTIPVTGAVIVTTPQQVAVADVIKSIGMFKANKIEVPILGIVENMSWFTPADAPDKKYHIFGKGGGQKLADKFNLKLLGQIPLVENIVENADNGKPAIMQEGSIESKVMLEIADNVVKQLNERNEKLDPTKIVEITTK